MKQHTFFNLSDIDFPGCGCKCTTREPPSYFVVCLDKATCRYKPINIGKEEQTICTTTLHHLCRKMTQTTKHQMTQQKPKYDSAKNDSAKK